MQLARLVLLLRRYPALPSPEAGRRLGQSASWVYRWRRRWAAEGFRLDDRSRSGRPRLYSSTDRALVLAVACERPSQRDLPLARHFASSIQAVIRGEGVQRSVRTVERVLAADTLKPWQYRSWMHPRDPDFRAKAAVIVGLYEGVRQGRRLDPADELVCADEKPGIQARRHAVHPPAPGCPARVESDYERCGALQHLCARDVRRGLPLERCEPRNGALVTDPWVIRGRGAVGSTRPG